MSDGKALGLGGLAHLVGLIKQAISDLGASVSTEIDKAVGEAVAAMPGQVSADGETIAQSDEGVLSVKDGGVSTAKLADQAATSAKIANGAVGTAKLADGAATSAKIADGAVGEAEIADHAVTPAKVSDLAGMRYAMGLGNTLAALPVANGGTGTTTLDQHFQQLVASRYPDNDDLLAYLELDGSGGSPEGGGTA